MTESIKIFLESHSDLLEKTKLAELYKIARIEQIKISDLTKTFLDINIDPLEYMTVVPSGYFYKASYSVNGVTIPDHIQKIEDHAFYNTDIQEIYVPEGVTEISTRAFGCCPDLLFVHLPHSLKLLQKSVFGGTRLLSEIYYNGTFAE